MIKDPMEVPTIIPTFWNKLLISYLYLVQGIYMALPISITMTYSKVPSYDTMSLFTASLLPFSFKFIFAPIVERFTSYEYGRRKTWTVSSMLLSAVVLYLQIQFLQEQYQRVTAILFIFNTFFIALQDISVDALAFKQLPAEMACFIQSLMHQLGSFIGSMLFIQLVLPNTFFANLLGFPHSIITVKTFFHLLALVTIIPTLIIHQFYKQKVLWYEAQLKSKQSNESLISLIKRFKQYFFIQYRGCRQILIFILYPHGVGYFTSGIAIELMNNYGLSKQLYTTYQNFTIFPILISNYILTQIVKRKKLQCNKSQIRILQMLHNFELNIYVIRFIILVILLSLTPYITSHWLICLGVICVVALLQSAQSFIDSILINSHVSVTRYPAMYGCMMGSLSNMGRNTSIQLKVMGKIGFESGCMIGIAWMMVWIMIFKRVTLWIRNGQVQQNHGFTKQAQLSDIQPKYD